MNHKRILIVGSAGFIGSNLAKELVKVGHDVVGVDSLKASYGEALPRIRRDKLSELSDSMEIIDGNILDEHVQDSILKKGPFDTVFHLAAWPGVRGGELDPESYLRNNIESLCSSLRTALRAGVGQFVFSSSSSVYGNQGLGGACSESIAREGNQLSFYAATKWIGERIISEFIKRTPMSGVAARFFTVIGKNGRPDMAYASFARAMIQGRPVQIYGDGSALRDYTSISDTVWALRCLIENDDLRYRKPGIFTPLNVGFGHSYTINQLVESIQKALGITDIKVEYRPQPPVDAQATLSDPALLHELFGQRNPESLDSMINSALADPNWIFE